MVEWFKELHPVIQALIATIFTWFLTALGASVVFFFKNVSRKVLDSMMGFAAGVMIAASFWSLLAPSIDMAKEQDMIAWIPAAVGFILGGFFIMGLDKVLPHLHLNLPTEKAEGISTSLHRSILLVLAITLHNIPEGLAIGVSFGALAHTADNAALIGAVTLAIGIGIQNFPEGLSVSVPLRREGFSRGKSFMYGQASAIVEPIAGVAGAAAVYYIEPILPYALAFAAGAMIFVVIEELIPESQSNKNEDLATIMAVIGFTVMMVLDVALG